MRIETMKADVAVHVNRADETVALTIEDGGGAGSNAATRAMFQAEILRRALSLVIAGIQEQQRRPVKEGQRLAHVVAEIDVPRR